MSNTNTLIGIQNAYIAKLKAIRSKPRRTNAMLTSSASKAAFKAILALGFTKDQANQAVNDATDVYFLDVNAIPVEGRGRE
jgi:Holliday junction resolvasome RuvABC DNA-binding subunit